MSKLDGPAHFWRNRKDTSMDMEVRVALDELRKRVNESQEGAELLAQVLQKFAAEVRDRLLKLENPTKETPSADPIIDRTTESI